MKLSSGYEIPVEPSVGDLLLFGGHSNLSKLIRLFTDRRNHAISHCALMVSDNTLVESTTLNGENGVGAVPLEHWIEEYPGEIWIKYLTKDARAQFDTKRFISFLLSQEGRPYDKSQVIFAACGVDRPQAWGSAKWYCSELAVAAYKEAGIIPINWYMGIAPAALAPLPIFETQAWQLKGKPKELR